MMHTHTHRHETTEVTGRISAPKCLNTTKGEEEETAQPMTKDKKKAIPSKHIPQCFMLFHVLTLDCTCGSKHLPSLVFPF
jgi:hypothetical protein